MAKHEIQLPSSLFPFTLAQVDRLEYDSYTLQNVFQSISQEQREACLDLWSRNRIPMTDEAAWQRSSQVCYYITETSTDKLVGVNTLYLDTINSPQQYWMNRMFIDPAYRNSRLMITGTALMLCYAKLNLSSQGIPGVVNINENRKLSRKGMHRIFSRLGYRRQGELAGQEVLYFQFDRIELKES